MQKEKGGQLHIGAEVARIALFTALLVVCSWIQIPAPVPFTLQTFALFLAVGVLGAKRAFLVACAYLLLGFVGVPVFSGFKMGFAAMISPTGGYLLGYYIGGLVMWAAEKIPLKKGGKILTLSMGLSVYYLCGVVWYAWIFVKGEVGVWAALVTCVIPFLLPDAAKMALAILLSGRVEKLLKKGKKAKEKKMDKKGWLVVNGFLQKEKFDVVYGFLKRSAEEKGVLIEIKRNTELFACDFSADLPDFVLFWDKDVALAKRIEKAGVPVFNSPSAIEICDDKIRTALCLEGKVATPKTLFAPKTFYGVGYTSLDFLRDAEKVLGLPFVIKHACGSFGAQVYLANTLEEAEGIVKKIEDKDFILQQFIQESRGRDVRINVVGDTVNSAMVRENPDDFRSNITNGGTATAYTPTQEETEIALAACREIGLDFAGVDVLFGKDGPIVCEVNSNPHFKSTYDCTGVDMSTSIIEHILEKLA